MSWQGGNIWTQDLGSFPKSLSRLPTNTLSTTLIISISEEGLVVDVEKLWRCYYISSCCEISITKRLRHGCSSQSLFFGNVFLWQQYSLKTSALFLMVIFAKITIPSNLVHEKYRHYSQYSNYSYRCPFLPIKVRGRRTVSYAK